MIRQLRRGLVAAGLVTAVLLTHGCEEGKSPSSAEPAGSPAAAGGGSRTPSSSVPASPPLDVVKLSPDSPSRPAGGPTTTSPPSPGVSPALPAAKPAPAAPGESSPSAPPSAVPATKADAIRRASEALTSAKSQVAALKQKRSSVAEDKVDHFNQSMMSLDWQVTKLTAGVEALKGAAGDAWRAVAQEIENVIAEMRQTIAEVREKYGIR